MQESNQALLKVANELQERPNLGNQLTRILLPEENRILTLKYKSKTFGQMSPHDLLFAGKALLLKVNVITGWVIPEDNLDLLIEIFTKKLVASYGSVNPDEFEYAFITEGTMIKDWGKVINLSLIDEVMLPYLEKRFELSRIEEQTKGAQKTIEYKEDLSEKAMSDWWKDVSRQVRVENYKMDFVAIALYEWMDKQGGISVTAKEKKEYLVRAMNYREGVLAELVEKNNCEDNRVVFSHFMNMKEEGCFTGKESDRLKSIAKKMVVYDMMKSEK